MLCLQGTLLLNRTITEFKAHVAANYLKSACQATPEVKKSTVLPIRHHLSQSTASATSKAFQLNNQAFRSFFFFFQLTSFSFRIVLLHCCTVLFCFFKFCYFIVVCQTRLGVQFWPAEHAAPPLHWLSCWAGWVQSKWPSIHQLVLDHGHRAGPAWRRRGRRRIW